MNIDTKWIGQMAKWALADGACLKAYLSVLAAVPDYSVNNQMLLLYESGNRNMPITKIRGKNEWESMGVSVNPEAAAFHIWEPDKDAEDHVIYQDDGKTPAGYHYKEMYDIRDTNLKAGGSAWKAERPQPSAEQALEALLTKQDLRLQVVDGIKNVNGMRAMYVPKEACIYVVRSAAAPADEFFSAIATEMGHAICHGMQKDTAVAYNRAKYHFLCCCSAYALCEKYGISTNAVNIDLVPERYVSCGERAAKTEIGRMAAIAKTVSSNMQMPLANIIRRDMEKNQPEAGDAHA